jgi:hypothetical protein
MTWVPKNPWHKLAAFQFLRGLGATFGCDYEKPCPHCGRDRGVSIRHHCPGDKSLRVDSSLRQPPSSPTDLTRFSGLLGMTEGNRESREGDPCDTTTASSRICERGKNCPIHHVLAAAALVVAFVLAVLAGPADAQYQQRILPPNTTVNAAVASGAGAAVSAACAAVTGQTNYLWTAGVTCTAPAATQTGVVTISGLQGGTISYEFVEPISPSSPELFPSFPPTPASATGTAITLSVPAISSGGTCAVYVVCSTQ